MCYSVIVYYIICMYILFCIRIYENHCDNLQFNAASKLLRPDISQGRDDYWIEKYKRRMGIQYRHNNTNA